MQLLLGCIYNYGVKPFILLNTLAVSMSFGFLGVESSDSKPDVPSQEKTMSRLYVYFGQVSVKESVTWLKADFYTQDGSVEHKTVYGVSLKPILDETSNVNIYYLDYPACYKVLSFEVGPEGSDGYWLKTGLIKIQNCAYLLDFNIRYTYLRDTSGWLPLALTQKQFVSYILASIDHTSNDSSCGFMTYPLIKNAFYDRITDYDENDAKHMMWTDVYTHETISFYDKWEQIKVNYENNCPAQSNSIAIKVLGVGVCLCSVAAFCFVARKSFHGKIKTEI